jgi:VanZ family protein
VFLFTIALRGDVYDLTSPPQFPWHVLLRKAYSVVAFAIVGWGYANLRRGVSWIDAALAIALYSGAIEIAQWFVGNEPLRWNLFDVACGALGGALGAAVFIRRAAGRAR